MPGGLPQAGTAGACEPDMAAVARAMVTQIHAAEQRHVTIALVGKYTELHDAYLSVAESLFHAGTACDAQVDIRWVDSRAPDGGKPGTEMLCGCGGILVPGGFGDRGIEGMILAAQYARENGCPLSGHLPGDADRGHRICAARSRVGGCPQRRVQRRDGTSGHRPDAGPGGRDRQGRHHAAWQVSLRAGGGEQRPGRPTASGRYGNATVTGMSAATCSGRSWRPWACG